MAALKKKKGMALTLTHSLSMSTNSTRLLPYLVLGGQESVSDMTTLAMLGVTHVLNVSNECKCWFEAELTYCVIPIHDEPDELASAHFARAHEFIDGVRQRHVAGEKVVCMVHCKTGMSRSSTMVLNHLMQATGLPRFIATYTNRTAMLQGAGAAADGTATGADGGSSSPATSAPASSGAGGGDDTATPTPASCVSRYSDGEDQHLTLRDALAYIRERRPRASPNPGFMQQLVELEVSLHGEPSIDVDKYKKDRFGDVRTFCLGTIDPLAGYTGTAPLPGGVDDKYLFAGGAGGSGDGTNTTDGAAAVSMQALGAVGVVPPAAEAVASVAVGGSDATVPTGSPQPLPASSGAPEAVSTATSATDGEEGWGRRAPPTRKAGEVKRKSLDFGFGDDEVDGVGAALSVQPQPAGGDGAGPDGSPLPFVPVVPGSEASPASSGSGRPLPPVRDRRHSAGPNSLFSPTAAGRPGGRSPAPAAAGAADITADPEIGPINSMPLLSPGEAGLAVAPGVPSRLAALPDVQPPRGARRSNVSPAAISSVAPDPHGSPSSGSGGDGLMMPGFSVTGESMRVQRTASTGSTDMDRRRVSSDSHGALSTGAGTMPMPTTSSAAAAVSAARMEVAASGVDVLDGIVAVGIAPDTTSAPAAATTSPAPFMSPVAGRRAGGSRRSPATTFTGPDEEPSGTAPMVPSVTGTPLTMSRSVPAATVSREVAVAAAASSAANPAPTGSSAPGGVSGSRTSSPLLAVGGTAIAKQTSSITSRPAALVPSAISASSGVGGGGDALDMLGATAGSDGSTALLIGALSHRSGYTDSPSRTIPSPVSAYPLPGSIGYGTGAAVSSTPLPSLSAAAFPLASPISEPLPGTSKLSVLGAGLRPPSANPLSPGGAVGPPLSVTSPQHGGLLASGAGATPTPISVVSGPPLASTAKTGRALAATGASVIAGGSSGVGGVPSPGATSMPSRTGTAMLPSTSPPSSGGPLAPIVGRTATTSTTGSRPHGR